MFAQPPSLKRKNEAGFALLAVAAVFLIAGTAIAVTSGTLEQTERARVERVDTRDRLIEIRQALLRFASRNQRLPCPALGSAPVSSKAGSTSVDLKADGRKCDYDGAPSGSSDASVGVVPWATLGLDRADAVDRWGRRISYRVYTGDSDGDGSFVQDNGVDFLTCIREIRDPAGKCAHDFQAEAVFNDLTTALTDGDPANGEIDTAEVTVDLLRNAFESAENGAYREMMTQFRRAIMKRLGVRVTVDSCDVADCGSANQIEELTNDFDPNVPGVGAAFVLISHGENGRGAWLPSGKKYVAATSEAEKANVTGEGDAFTGFRALGYRGSEGSGAFDDIVESVNIRDMAARTGLWPDLATYRQEEWADEDGDGTPDILQKLQGEDPDPPAGMCSPSDDDFLVRYDFVTGQVRGDPSAVTVSADPPDRFGTFRDGDNVRVAYYTYSTHSEHGYPNGIRVYAEGRGANNFPPMDHDISNVVLYLHGVPAGQDVDEDDGDDDACPEGQGNPGNDKCVGNAGEHPNGDEDDWGSGSEGRSDSDENSGAGGPGNGPPPHAGGVDDEENGEEEEGAGDQNVDWRLVAVSVKAGPNHKDNDYGPGEGQRFLLDESFDGELDELWGWAPDAEFSYDDAFQGHDGADATGVAHYQSWTASGQGLVLAEENLDGNAIQRADFCAGAGDPDTVPEDSTDGGPGDAGEPGPASRYRKVKIEDFPEGDDAIRDADELPFVAFLEAYNAGIDGEDGDDEGNGDDGSENDGAEDDGDEKCAEGQGNPGNDKCVGNAGEKPNGKNGWGAGDRGRGDRD